MTRQPSSLHGLPVQGAGQSDQPKLPAVAAAFQEKLLTVPGSQLTLLCYLSITGWSPTTEQNTLCSLTLDSKWTDGKFKLADLYRQACYSRRREDGWVWFPWQVTELWLGCDLHDGSGCPKGNVSATVEQGHMSKWTLCLVWLALRAKTNVKLIYFCALDISLCLCPAMGGIMSNLYLPHIQLNNNRRSSHHLNKKHQQQTPSAHLSAYSTSMPPPPLYYYQNWPRPRFSEVL